MPSVASAQIDRFKPLTGRRVILMSPSTMFTADNISPFLQDTKGKHKVEVELYFPDCSQFINDASLLKKDGASADTEVFRLHKIISKLKPRARRKSLPSLQHV